MGRKYYQGEIEKWKMDYENGNTILGISQKYKVGRSTITKYLRKSEVNIVSTGEARRKYAFDETFFNDINTEQQAYWLGYLCADGNIGRCKNRNLSTVSICSKDKNHLEKFSLAINYNGPMREMKNGCGVVAIYSEHVQSELISKGIIANKSLSLAFPSGVPSEMNNHFIRGYFDGNGCVVYSDRRGRRNSKGQTKGGIDMTFNIVGARPILTTISKIMANSIEIPFKEPTDKSSVAWFHHTGTVRIRKIRDWLYKDATVFLERKRLIFNMI